MCLLLEKFLNYFNHKESNKVLMVGLKTPAQDSVLLNKELRSFNVEVVKYRAMKLEVWNLQGVDVTRPFWSSYLDKTKALVIFINTGRQDTLHDTRLLLQGLMSIHDLKHCPVLFLDSNIYNPYPSDKLLREILLLPSGDRPYHVSICNTNNGWEGGWGSFDGLDWLVAQLGVGKHVEDECDSGRNNVVQTNKSNQISRTKTWTVTYSTSNGSVSFENK